MNIIIFQTAEPLQIDEGDARPMRAINLSNKFLEESNDHKPHPSASNHRLWAYNVFNLMKK